MKGTGDLQRLRTEITDVYIAVVLQEARPGNLQLERVQMLKQEIKKAEQQNNLLNQKFEKKAMDIINADLLKKSKVKPSGKN